MLSLSQVQSWDTDHLSEAVVRWMGVVESWESAFANLSTQVRSPGGTAWSGPAAEAAQARADSERLAAQLAADQLIEAATIARAGAREIDAAKQRVIAAVDAATAVGFTVHEDFSVADRRPGGATGDPRRIAQAQELAGEIRMRLNELLAVDAEVASKLTAVTADLRTEHTGDRGPHVQAVDYWTVKEAPPQPEPPAPPPGPLKPVSGADDVKRILDSLPLGGRRGTNGVGTRADVVEVWDTGSVKRLWEYLTRDSVESNSRSTYEGSVRVLPDGTEIGLRQSGKGWNDTIDVWYPDGANEKIHTPYAPYFPIAGEPPALPPMVADPVHVPIPPPQTGHGPVVPIPNGVFEPNGLPPWLLDPSTPGFHSPTQAPTIMPGVTLPEAPCSDEPYPSTEPSEQPDLLPELRHDLAEVGKAVGAGVLAGIVLTGALAVEVVVPGQQFAP